MKTIVCEQPNEFKPVIAEHPTQKQGEAIVAIKQIGICGTDYHAYKGNQPFFVYPRVLGHELAGVIEWVGENDAGLKEGDQVTVIPYLACGECVACRRGKTNCCAQMKVLGVHIDGGMTEKISVPHENLIKTDGLSLDESTVVEPLSIGAHAVRRAGIQKGEYALVIGAGPIGLGVMAFAQQEGAKVIAMDINQERLGFCQRWANVDFIVNALESPIDSIQEITGGDLPTIVFDATGNRKSMEGAFQYPANGGKLIYVGLVRSNIMFFDPDFHAKELTLMGSRNATKEDFVHVINSIKRGKVDVGSYITHRSSFEEMIEHFDEWMKPETGVVKAIVQM
ncbi:zinc-binding alcohol dehydrogenase family protein [Pullulanibacillus sp. KACC 23026]|uniref:zinc-binding alcohol dehydrogenase family protein n=1 Tax=Pullulanibacillus sp. KACC 23026 TaxID=3028315 RepID=UPI0023AEB01F|nr:zinc-binding alcohol dehydrogenase family protein [Pullulanibacillus sp. KACC 23026]WEG11085.1 zinc-binding alcohol dehydrogenase family protein [Pullulanibacillus sp. KACC 23026]